ncbi:hypothetical protein [Streptomyces sp. NPDC060002]|uniref:hypothetical protein n=1 Tax=Streptomyces sp. NPDC060002 TaxID=3347033 RepID=UPI0036747249
MRTHGTLTRLPADHAAEVPTGVGATIDARGRSLTASRATVAVTGMRDVDA